MKKTITLLLTALILTIFSGCLNNQNQGLEQEEEVAEEILNYESYMICDNNKFPFKLDKIGGAHGQFVFTGTITDELEQKPWSMDETDLIPVVRMQVNHSDISEALEYYKEMANRGNTINDIEGGGLGFKLGIIDNEEFSSSAKISESAIEKIFDALESGEEISLTLTQAFLPGMGAPANYSFACEIEGHP